MSRVESLVCITLNPSLHQAWSILNLVCLQLVALSNSFKPWIEPKLGLDRFSSPICACVLRSKCVISMHVQKNELGLRRCSYLNNLQPWSWIAPNLPYVLPDALNCMHADLIWNWPDCSDGENRLLGGASCNIDLPQVLWSGRASS